MDSPASMSDAGIDALDDDTGIFLGSPKPQEQYFQKRLTRSSKLHIPTDFSSNVGTSRMAALDLTNETVSELQHNSTGTCPEPPEMHLAQSEHESNTPARVTPSPQHTDDLSNDQEAISSLPGFSSSSAATTMPVHDDIINSNRLETSTLHNQLSQTSPRQDEPHTSTRPSTPNLISFDSIVITTSTSPTHRPLSPPVSRVDLLEATPEAATQPCPISQPPSTPSVTSAVPPLGSLIFTPHTTASFVVPPQSQQRLNAVLLMTKETDSPPPVRLTHTMSPIQEQLSALPEQPSAKRPRTVPETPAASAKRNPRTPNTQKRRMSSLPRRTPGLSTQQAGTSHDAPATLRTLRSVSPTSDAILDTISMVCGPVRSRRESASVLGALPEVEPSGVMSRSKAGEPIRGKTPDLQHQHQQQLEEPAPPVVSPPNVFRIPPNFRFTASSNAPPIRSPTKKTEVKTPGKTPSLNPKAKATRSGETTPLKPIVFSLDLMKKMSPKRLAASTTAGALKADDRQALAASILGSPSRTGFPIPPPSPKKMHAVATATPLRNSRAAWPSPVRPTLPLKAGPLAHVAKPLRLNLSAAASNHHVAKVPRVVPPAMAATKAAAPMPLRDLNLGKEVAQVDVLAKPSGLPLPKAFRSSRLPQIGAGGRNRNGPITTVNMVHMPHVSITGSPIEAPRKPNPQPKTQKRFRAVVPGTLTGWEGKPVVEEHADAGPSSGSVSGTDEAMVNGVNDDLTDSDNPTTTTSVDTTVTVGTERNAHTSQIRSRRALSSPSPETPSPRRSRRLSKEKENDVADGNDGSEIARIPVDASRTAAGRAADTRILHSAGIERPRSKSSTPRLAGAAKKGLTSDTDITEISARELQALTTRNTTHNQRYFISLDRRVIKKDCPRPPSPSSKVRAAIPEEQLDKESARLGRAERAKRRGLLEDEMDTEDAESNPGGRTPTKHARGAGDEEDYETPKRRRLNGDGAYADGEDMNVQPFAALTLARPAIEKRPTGADLDVDAASDGNERVVKPNSGGRFVRWHKKLVFDCEEGETIEVARHGNGGILAKDADALGLDKRGNVPEANKRPDGLEKGVVVVVKYVYADDSDHEEPPPPTVRRTKRKRASSAET
ncbi:hypothetical protein FRB95_004499 [Tulasnella sp. JGI-2019a]|nr:hypothetical protein FRB95_004499 [Tulasnella sp. JGI-2019a]